MTVYFHCRACGRVFPVEPEKVRASCIECGRGPVFRTGKLFTRLAKKCGADRINVYVRSRRKGSIP